MFWAVSREKKIACIHRVAVYSFALITCMKSPRLEIYAKTKPKITFSIPQTVFFSSSGEYILLCVLLHWCSQFISFLNAQYKWNERLFTMASKTSKFFHPIFVLLKINCILTIINHNSYGLIHHNIHSEKAAATLFRDTVNFNDNKFGISLAFHCRPTNNERLLLSKHNEYLILSSYRLISYMILSHRPTKSKEKILYACDENMEEGSRTLSCSPVC